MQHDLVLRAEAPSEKVVTIHLAGVVDAHTLDKFEAEMAKALVAGARSLLLDCEELRYVNSSGFGELIRYFDRVRERGGTLVLARVPPKVGVILEMLGLKSLIPIVTTMEEGLAIAESGGAPPPLEAPELAVPAARPALPGAAPSRITVSAPAPRITQQPAPARIAGGSPLVADERVVICAFCDTRIRIGGDGRWACPACGAPFSTTSEGGVAFDWSRADAEGVHLTFDVSPRTLAAFAGLLEGVLIERRVSHARMRRFAREAAHVCQLVADHAFAGGRHGPLHVLALAGPQRLHLRIVDRGRSLEAEAERLFGTQTRLFLDFRYLSPAEGVNVTEFAFAYAGSGVFVG